jgi:hypothetical protein
MGYVVGTEKPVVRTGNGGRQPNGLQVTLGWELSEASSLLPFSLQASHPGFLLAQKPVKLSRL